MKGITLPCSGCKQILLRYANIKGEGSFETRCPHCQATNMVTISQKPTIVSVLLKMLMFLFIIGGFIYFSSNLEYTKSFVVNLFDR